MSLIDGMYPTDKPADVSARDSMQFEAQNVFLAVDDLYQVRSCLHSHGASVHASRANDMYCAIKHAHERMFCRRAGGMWVLICRGGPASTVLPNHGSAFRTARGAGSIGRRRRARGG